MALIRTGALVSAISGTAGGVNFAASSNSQYVRSVARRRPANSEAQQRHQSRVAASIAAWNRLQPDVRTAWRRFAETQPRVSRLGLNRAVTGYALYLAHALEAWDGQPPANLMPPSVVRHLAPVSLSLSATAPNAVTLSQSGTPLPPPNPDLTARIWLHRFARPTQQSAWNNKRRIADIEDPPLDIDLTAQLEPLGIYLQPYERIGVGVAWRWCKNTFGHVVWTHLSVTP